MPYLLRLLVCCFVTCVGIDNGTAQEVGIASFYHSRFHGKKTASGQIHDSGKLTAAHRTLPFGTFVRVTNLDNMKSIIVQIQDRGPFRKGWILDLSPKAAEELDFIKKGITMVRMQVVPANIDLSQLELLCLHQRRLPVPVWQPDSILRLPFPVVTRPEKKKRIFFF